MSAIGAKRTWASALHMSAFGGKADITFCGANVRLWPKADMAIALRNVCLKRTFATALLKAVC